MSANVTPLAFACASAGASGALGNLGSVFAFSSISQQL